MALEGILISNKGGSLLVPFLIYRFLFYLCEHALIQLKRALACLSGDFLKFLPNKAKNRRSGIEIYTAISKNDDGVVEVLILQGFLVIPYEKSIPPSGVYGYGGVAVIERI